MAEKYVPKTVQAVPEPEVQLPQLNVNMPPATQGQDGLPPAVITNEDMQTLYKELLQYCRDDRHDADESFRQFLDLVINEGDATAASKEAMVQLLRIKVEATDKMAKVMDLLMRSLLRERDTGFPRYLAAHQENNLIFKGSGGKRGFLERLEKMKQRKEDSK